MNLIKFIKFIIYWVLQIQRFLRDIESNLPLLYLNRLATHMEINFPTKHGTGIERLLTGTSKDCIDLIKLMLMYDPEERITAS